MPDQAAPILSAIIVSYNTRQTTLDCLRALMADIRELPAEVFVVDNASRDGSAAAIRSEFPSVLMIENQRNAGFGAANNMALRMARGNHILLLNSDAFVKPGAISALLQLISRRPEVAVVGPRLTNADGSLQRSCYRFPSPLRAVYENLLLTAAFPNHSLVGDYRRWEHDFERDVDFVIGACMLVRREAFDGVGGFDEQFFLYAEEEDWCKRIADAGWKVTFTPAAEVMHLNGGSGKSQPDRVFDEFHRGAERYLRKHHGSIGLFVYRVAIVFGSLVRISVFSLSILMPGRCRRGITLTRTWLRILKWSVGFRGPGLAANI